ncbi:MAG TPA: DUF305 domain-containing protein [Pedococcus sp.]|nr:DUF305 domain-containing protein [Pedococcus sp.]
MSARLRAVAMLAAAAITLSGCGGASQAGGTDEHNAADVEFAQEMIPHHQQAVMMAEMVQRHGASGHLEDLAERIETAQEAEIDLMAGMLDAWGEDAAWLGHMRSSQRMHGWARDRGDGWGPMMMGRRPYGYLMRGRQGGFERMWLTMMIAHHRVALRMTATEQAEGRSPDLMALAARMESVQRAEIAEMREMLRG